MEFLGIGYQELIVVMFLLLVVVGPERLPGMAYQIGRAVRQMQQYARAVRDEFSDEIGYIEDQYKTVRGEVDQTKQTLREHQAQLDSGMREVTAPVQEAATTASAALADTPAPAATTDPVAMFNNGVASPAPEKADEPAAPAPPPLVF